MFHDYNTATDSQTVHESVTCFWAMWSVLASKEQASLMVNFALPKFEACGGLTCTTAKSRGPESPGEPTRQWDYPFGWVPHQMMAWDGLRKYGFVKEAKRLAYRWLNTVTRTAADYNGTIVEKYDVTLPAGNHKVEAEYGNQGRDFRGLPREG